MRGPGGLKTFSHPCQRKQTTSSSSSVYSGIIELLLQLRMHPSVSLISVKSQDVCRRAAVAAADFTAPLDARAGFLMSRRSCDIVACPLICRRGWHYQSLPLRRRFEHAASVQTDGSQFAVVFTCLPCLFCLCRQCPHVV